MIDSIGTATSLPSTQRALTLSQTNSLRSTAVLTAIQQAPQKMSGATAPVRIFAVPQSPRGGSSSTARLPRGSLIDVFA